MLDFQRYQIAFAAHIRDPKNNPRPKGVPAKRIGVYTHGVYLNVKEVVSACFPVCQKVIGPRKWQQVCKLFFAQHATETPIFREIPEEFLDFINTDDLTALKLPNFFQQLAHYEWVELAVSAMQTTVPVLSETTRLLDQTPALAPAHMLLQYDYPVQKISATFKPEQTETTHLLVYRTESGEINFVELNPMTYVLLQMVKEGISGKQALTTLAEQIQHPDPKVIIEFGHDILQDLLQQQAIVGSR